ncbi:hypothetical protein K491DRAFT_49420 [Lophiostoma macrostomum CBS 122681]|uniref:Uncharacterized protein n=1 Tax=Lophiostoma macrostomum CBS 122681 TaxID=1314788 RepID=A0A6A6T1H5_9PLEO|nr:hypothetical protein K491DRAFT_49420 [Lophiostoma macrostomum CBS 122681]
MAGPTHSKQRGLTRVRIVGRLRSAERPAFHCQREAWELTEKSSRARREVLSVPERASGQRGLGGEEDLRRCSGRVEGCSGTVRLTERGSRQVRSRPVLNAYTRLLVPRRRALRVLTTRVRGWRAAFWQCAAFDDAASQSIDFSRFCALSSKVLCASSAQLPRYLCAQLKKLLQALCPLPAFGSCTLLELHQLLRLTADPCPLSGTDCPISSEPHRPITGPVAR